MTIEPITPAAAKPGFWRGVLGFIVFLPAFIVGAIINELLFGLANLIAHNWSANWSAVIGAAIGGMVGVAAGQVALDRFVKRYPARGIAAAFITLNVIIAAGDLLIVPPEGYNVTVAVQVVRAIVASGFTIYALWLDHDLTGGRFS